MNRLLVVPWSMAPTKSGIGVTPSISLRVTLSSRLGFRWLPRPGHRLRLGDRPRDFLGDLQPGMQHITDEQVVDDHTDDTADQRPDYRYPPVVGELEATQAVRAWQRHLPPAREVREQAGPEVAGRVDRVDRVRA